MVPCPQHLGIVWQLVAPCVAVWSVHVFPAATLLGSVVVVVGSHQARHYLAVVGHSNGFDHVAGLGYDSLF